MLEGQQQIWMPTGTLQDSSPDLAKEDTYNRIFRLSVLSSSQIEILFLEVKLVRTQEDTKTSSKHQQQYNIYIIVIRTMNLPGTNFTSVSVLL